MPPKLPTRSFALGLMTMWCVVCEGDDFNHEHPDDPRAPKFGDGVDYGTVEETAWVAYQRSLPLEEQHYYKRLRERDAQKKINQHGKALQHVRA